MRIGGSHTCITGAASAKYSHVEYEIKGDSRKEENWQETGNKVYPNNSKK